MILPASSFFEKVGTYTNTDRRVQIGRPVIPTPGQAWLDWQVLCELSTRLGYPMSYESPEQVFEEFVSLSPSYAGLNYDLLQGGGKVWPYQPAGSAAIPPATRHAAETAALPGNYSANSSSSPTPSRRRAGAASLCRRSSRRPKDLPDSEFPSCSTPVVCWSTGTPGP